MHVNVKLFLNNFRWKSVSFLYGSAMPYIYVYTRSGKMYITRNYHVLG